MNAKPVLFCICLLFGTKIASAARLQGPAGEVINRLPPPPVDEEAAARAERAARQRRQAAIADQFELALKSGNDALGRAWPPGLFPQLVSQAEADYQRAAKLKPRDWRSYLGLGRAYLQQKRNGDAVGAFQRAIALKPNNAELYYELSGVYQSQYSETPGSATTDRQHLLEERIRALESSVELDPTEKNKYAFGKLAEAYNSAERHQKAIATYQRLLILPHIVDEALIVTAHLGLAQSYEHTGRFPEAIGEYRELIKSNPGDRLHDSRALDYYFELGYLYFREKRYAEAIEANEQAKTLDDPRHARADIALGSVYVETHDYDKALEAFTRATKLEPKDWYAFAQIGHVYYLQKQYEESLQPLQQAISLTPEIIVIPLPAPFDEPHYYLGLSQLMLGHKSEAMEQYEELKKLKSNFADKLLSEINKQ